MNKEVKKAKNGGPKEFGFSKMIGTNRVKEHNSIDSQRDKVFLLQLNILITFSFIG